MNIHAVKTDRMDITIDLSSHYIFVQQKWKYNWLIDSSYSGQSDWTIQEKRNFHNKSDQIIWKLWSAKAYATMQGSSVLARQYRNIKFDINIDVKWTTGSETAHWNVDVYKVPTGVVRGSSAHWGNRKITLDSEDYKPRTDSAAPGQIPIAHELGHTFRDSTRHSLGILDEYSRASISNARYHSDSGSIMNIGTGVRTRHYNYLREQLNILLPTASFDINL